ncbi:SDR family NAD(P)-dependent oxidoreductase, partial [Senegalimassilia anaerobia]|uniref:SDR family NAD(P)-dependent oxidoreductase n=3 Tax=Coriobacteriaceae TaxID=84107 RepID=UPI003A986426
MVLPENVEGFQNGAGVGGAARTGGAVPVADVPQSGRDDAVSRAAVSQVASADLAAGPHSSRANPDPLDGRADAPSAFSSQQPPALCALVTGATGGIGRELCAQLARECGTLALVGRDRGKLEELAKDLAERFDVDTHVFVVDFVRPGAVDALASQVQAANLQVETLVNN